MTLIVIRIWRRSRATRYWSAVVRWRHRVTCCITWASRRETRHPGSLGTINALSSDSMTGCSGSSSSSSSNSSSNSKTRKKKNIYIKRHSSTQLLRIVHNKNRLAVKQTLSMLTTYSSTSSRCCCDSCSSICSSCRRQFDRLFAISTVGVEGRKSPLPHVPQIDVGILLQLLQQQQLQQQQQLLLLLQLQLLLVREPVKRAADWNEVLSPEQIQQVCCSFRSMYFLSL